jgi:hypothetical protein
MAAERRPAGQDVSQRDGDFQARERGAETVVRAVAECERRRPGSVEPKLVGRSEDRRIPVGGGKHDDGRLARANRQVVNHVVVRGGAAHRLHRAIKAEQLGDQWVSYGLDGVDRSTARPLPARSRR